MKYIYNFIIRYFLIFTPLSFLYLVFLPITIYGVFGLLYFWDPVILGDIIIVKGIQFTFIDACIAIGAYWLLLFLTLTTKDIKFITRIKIIIFGFLLVLAMNYFRIWILVILTVKYGLGMFNTVHLIFWKFVSWIYVAFVWILLIKLYKIKSIPVYNDLKYLIGEIRKNRSKKRH